LTGGGRDGRRRPGAGGGRRQPPGAGGGRRQPPGAGGGRSPAAGAGGPGRGAGPWSATGRDARLIDLLGQVIIGLVVGLIGLVVIDGIFALLGLGTFGHASGWIIAILPVWLFAEEFRAWPGVVLRIGVAAFAALIGLALGSLVGGVIPALPPLGVGAVGAAVATLSYAMVWFFGVRWVAGRVGER
jgi:hypothetical protein